jgi:hypothetical protein
MYVCMLLFYFVPDTTRDDNHLKKNGVMDLPLLSL